jgi:hypothetical protein
MVPQWLELDPFISSGKTTFINATFLSTTHLPNTNHKYLLSFNLHIIFMASEALLPPRQASPTRRALANLPTNINITPQRIACKATSPVKPGTPLTPALLLSTKKAEKKMLVAPSLNPPKKRPIDDVVAAERDETRISTSFSSLINFDSSSDEIEAPEKDVPTPSNISFKV